MSLICEYIKRKWGDRPSVDLAKKIAKAKADEIGRECGKKDYESYKGYVNKWLKGEQEPGKQYLIHLSEILGVSVESLLVGKDIVNEYGDRPTAYSAALSGNERIIDRLFRNKEDIYLDDEDEYHKSFVDYVVEFNNYQAFKIAIEKGYNYPDKYSKTELNPAVKEIDNKLAKMIIENDDVEMFEKIFGHLENEPSTHAVFRKYEMTNEIIYMILKSQKILRWFMKSKPFSLNEWHLFNDEDDKKFFRSENQKYQHVIDNIPSVAYGFNILLAKCIKENLMDTLEILLDFSIDHMQKVITVLGDDISKFEIDKKEKIIQLKDEKWAALGFVPWLENTFDNASEKISMKIEEINQLISRIGK